VGEVLGTAWTRAEGVSSVWRDPARRRWVAMGLAGIVLLLALAVVFPVLSRRGTDSPAAPPAAQQPGDAAPAPGGEAPAAQPPAAQPPAAQPAEGQPAAPAEGVPAEESPVRQLAFAALPLLLGLFWLLSAWLVDSEARRAFVIKEPWGDRRTPAYTALAVGCVFPLILAGLIFSAWGFVTFILDVSRRQNPVAGLQAGAIILMVCAGFLVIRGLIARWLDQRRQI
jgi:hypothetical protein